MPRSVRLAVLFCLPLGLVAAEPRAQDQVTIYHCVDAGGRVSVRDTPCPPGQQQEARSMVRPKDPPPSAPSPAPEPVAAPAPPPERVVTLVPPRPLYECVRPDGSVYESDTGDGNPRWVPLWTLGYPAGPAPRIVHQGGVSRDGLSAPPRSDISIPPNPPRPSGAAFPPRPRPPHGHPFAGYSPGTWVRDDCHALPQAEVCDRLRDRREELRRRFFNAQQRERDTLRVEERGLNARLANDCGIR